MTIAAIAIPAIIITGLALYKIFKPKRKKYRYTSFGQNVFQFQDRKRKR